MLDVEDFGAVGDGSTNDRTAIQAAIDTAIGGGGGTIRFRAGKVYYLGTLSSGATALTATQPADIVFLGNGAQLRVDTTDSSVTFVLKLRCPRRIVMRQLRFHDDGADLSITWRGAYGVFAESIASEGRCGQLLLEQCSATSCLGLFTVGPGSTADRLEQWCLVNCDVRSSYYGVVCQDNGDYGEVVNLVTQNVRRAYFVYGVTSQVANVHVDHDGTALGSTGAITIGRIVRDTSKIRVRATFSGAATQYNNAFLLSTQSNEATAAIRDIDLDLQCRGLTSPNFMSPLTIAAHNASSVLQATTGHIFTRITLSGDIGDITTQAGTQPIVVSSLQAVEAIFTLGPGIGKALRAYQPLMPGFVVRDGTEREWRAISGDLTSQTVVVPLAEFESTAVALRVTVFATDSTSLAAQNTTWQQATLIGYNAGGGAVTVQVTAAVQQASQGTAVTIGYAGSGENLVVSFSGATYNGANAYARVWVEYVSAGPLR